MAGVSFPVRLQEVAVVVAMHEMGDHLRVGLALELIAFLLELGAQLLVVLDDAVVHEGDLPARDHRVGVVRRRGAMRGPARVRDAGLRLQSLGVHLPGEVFHARDAAHALQVGAVQRRHAAGIVAAVLEAPQALDQDGDDVATGGCADDAAHGYFFRCFQLGRDTCLARASVSCPGGVFLLMVEPAPM